MKVQLFTLLEDDLGEDVYGWCDCWIDESKIDVFYVPKDKIDEFGEYVNIFIKGEKYSLKQEDALVKFLDKKFNIGFYK